MRKILMSLLAAAAAYAVRMVTQRLLEAKAPKPADWRDAQAPAPDDRAGASPDEALSDDRAHPHGATTPDHPAEVVDLHPDDGLTEGSSGTATADPQGGKTP